MTTRKKGKWEKVGHVSVDSGTIWIGDPCYVMDPDPAHRPKALGVDEEGFDDFLQQVTDDEKPPQAVVVNHDLGHPGLGVLISTGLGDGYFPVEIHRHANGDITMVTITFYNNRLRGEKEDE